MSEQDRIFMKNFALVLAGLVVFTLAIIAIAWNLNDLADRPPDNTLDAIVQERLAPIGTVATSEADLAAQAPSAPAIAAAAFDGTLDGEVIYGQVCATCHLQGIAGAPKLETAAWEGRLAQGMDTLVTHAIQGYQGKQGYMPARGGRGDLSDEQVRASVQWMVDNLE